MKTYIDKPIRGSLLPTLLFALLLSARTVCAEEISLRIPAQRIDAEPGGTVQLSFAGALQAFLSGNAPNDAPTIAGPGDFVGTAKIGDVAPVDVNLSTNGDRLEFTVPAQLGQNQKQANNHKVKITITRGTNSFELPGHAILTVYPLGTPLVKSIDDLASDRYQWVHADEPFTVNGGGFFAPADQIKLFARNEKGVRQEAEIISVAHDGTSFNAVFRGSGLPPAGPQSLDVYVWGHDANRKAVGIWVEDLKKKNVGLAALFALVPVGLMVLAVFGLCGGVRESKSKEDKSPSGQFKPTSLLETMLVDSASNTYSLARVQFASWLVVLVYSYGFIFVMRGMVAAKWSFPEFAGAELAFLISLGTLVGSVATTTFVGPKGTGDLKPRPSDLILHGGVLAFDRIQQLVWTFVAMAIFLTIVHHTSGTTEALPEIPGDLLKLMGLSSLGYLVGKAVRKPGPALRTVSKNAEGLQVQGLNLSTHARILIDGKDIPADSIQFEKEKAGEVTDAIMIKGDYDPSKIKVTVINPDGQEANWTEKSAASAS